MRVHLENYRIIKDADIDIEGLTLVRGQNDSGKSCLMRAMKTLANNASGDGQIRYCAPGMAIQIEDPDKGFPVFRYERERGKTPTLSVGGGKPVDKLGRVPTAEIDSRFPFKVIQLQDDKFLPNFVFQKEVPIFGQVDVYAFFASMFDSVAQVSRHLLVVRKRFASAQSTDSAAKAQLEGYAQLVADAETTLLGANGPEIDRKYEECQAALKAAEEYAKLYYDWEPASRELKAYDALEGFLSQDMDAVVRHVELIDAARASLARLRSAEQATAAARAELARVDSIRKAGSKVSKKTVDLLTGSALLLKSAVFAGTRKAKAEYDLMAAKGWEKIPGMEIIAARTWARTPDLYRSLARLRSIQSRSGPLGAKISVIKAQVAPVLGTAEKHAVYLRSYLQLAKAKQAVDDSSARIEHMSHELSGVTSCPVCGEALKVPMTQLLGG